MILAAGLTPAWQQILEFAALHAGEVNRAEAATGCASGKVLNVGSAVHHLGVLSHTLSPVGGFTGQQIQADFAQLGIPATWIPAAAATRVCTTLLDRTTCRTTELVENSAALSGEELQNYFDAFQELAVDVDMVVLSGSLPHNTPADFYADLVEVVPGRVLLDARGPELLACLPAKPWLVKPNREELSRTLDRSLNRKDDLIAAMRELQVAGARHVIVSDGSAGLYAADAHGVEHYPVVPVTTINPIGCGDSLAAGIAVAAVEGRNWHDAVEFGIAAATENATRLLPARFTRAAVDARLAGVA